MHHTIGYLLGKPEDFKTCDGCGAFNWYENGDCVSCNGTAFHPTTKQEVEAYADARGKGDEHFCEECEIDV
jgi:hypothetical protein